MAVTVDSVIVELEAKVAGFENDLRRAQRTADTALGRTDRAIQRTERQMRQSSTAIQGTLRNLAGAFATAFTGRELLNLIDGFTRFQNQLRVAGLEGEQLANVQERLRTIGGRYGVELEGLASIFSRVSQVQNELGVGTEDIIRLNEIVAASLKVSGASAAQAQGALLQLSQALGSGTVRAEEFNSILEGALPLAQAAARGIDRFGGSVAALRQAVLQGEISSREFFEGVLAGGVQTLEQAENATLTLSGAFTALRNELTILVGTESQASGATATLAAAIQGLADNLDTIIPALAIIATAFAGRYVAGALAASTATRALSAHMAIATTSMAGAGLAARSAGAALLGAFGGPVGLAITGVALGLAFVAQRANEATQASEEYRSKAEEVRAATRRLTQAQERLASAHGRTRVEALAAAEAERQNAIQKLESARASLALAAAERAQARAAARASAQDRGTSAGAGGRFGFGEQVRSNRDSSIAEANFNSARQDVIDIREALESLEVTINPVSRSGTGTPSEAGGRTRGGATQATQAQLDQEALERAFRAAQEQDRLDEELIQAKLDLVSNADERAQLERELLDAEARRRREEIDRNASDQIATANENFTGRQRQDIIEAVNQEREAQLAIIDELFGVAAQVNEQGEIIATANRGLLGQRITRDRIAQQLQEEVSLNEEILRGHRETLEGDLDRAVTLEDRRRLQLEIIDIEFRQREAALQALLASQDITDIRRQEIEVALENLRIARDNQRDRANRDTESPLERFNRELGDSLQTVDEQIEGIQVNALRDLNSGLADAIVSGGSLGDVFEDAGRRALSALIELTVQLLVIKPLLDSLGGGTGSQGGGLGSLFGGLFGGGRQTGGPVTAGRLYQVNEGAGQGVELFQPNTNGTVIPLGQVPAMTNRQAPQSSEPAVIRISVVEGSPFEPMVEAISGRVSIETVRETAPQIVQRSVEETVKINRRRRT